MGSDLAALKDALALLEEAVQRLPGHSGIALIVSLAVTLSAAAEILASALGLL